MALQTLFNSVQHPLTWDKVNQSLKIADENFTFALSAVTSGDLSALEQNVVPNGTYTIGTLANPWSNGYFDTLTVTAVSANLTGDVTGNVTGNLTTGNVSIVPDRVTTPEIEGVGDLLAIYGNWAGDTGISIVSTNNLESLTLSSDRIVAVSTDVGGTQKDWIFETTGVLTLPAGGYISGNVVGDVTGDVTGNADTATTAAVATQVTVTNETGGGIATYYPTFVASNSTGDQSVLVDTGLTYKPGVNFLDLDGTVRGNGLTANNNLIVGGKGSIGGILTQSVLDVTNLDIVIDLSDVNNLTSNTIYANQISGDTTLSIPFAGDTDMAGTHLTIANGNSVTNLYVEDAYTAAITTVAPLTAVQIASDGYQWNVLGGSGSGSGTSLGSRTTKAASTSSLADGATGSTTVTGAYKGYALLKINTNAASWVRVYTSQAARTADASRLETEDPLPGAGVIAEVITTGSETVVMSPGVIGFNDESTPVNEIYLAVKNKSGTTQAITVTLTLLQLEA